MPETKNLNSMENLPQPPEKLPSSEQPEQTAEARTEAATEQNIESVDSGVQTAVLPSAPSAPIAPVISGEIELKKVESILAQGLESLYLSLDASQQQVFRVKGEETGRKIVKLLQSAKVSAGKIIALIIDWLRVIPRVNRHFLEQEAKIKAEEIMAWYAKQRQ